VNQFIGLMTLLLMSSVMAKSVQIKDRASGDLIKITSERGLCVENDVIVCDFAIISILDKNQNSIEIVNTSDKVNIYTVIDKINKNLCVKVHACRYEAPYERSVNIVKQFKGAAVLQVPFYVAVDTIRLPYLLGSTIVQSLKFNMVKGRRVIRNIDPTRKDKKIKTVRFSSKTFKKLRYTLENEL